MARTLAMSVKGGFVSQGEGGAGRAPAQRRGQSDSPPSRTHNSAATPTVIQTGSDLKNGNGHKGMRAMCKNRAMLAAESDVGGMQQAKSKCAISPRVLSALPAGLVTAAGRINHVGDSSRMKTMHSKPSGARNVCRPPHHQPPPEQSGCAWACSAVLLLLVSRPESSLLRYHETIPRVRAHGVLATARA